MQPPHKILSAELACRQREHELLLLVDRGIDLAGVPGVLPPLRELYARLNDASSPGSMAAAGQAKPEAGTLEALRALGYLQ